MTGTSGAYDVWAPSYDAFDNPMIAMVEHALDRAPLRVAGHRVVELGCGTGRNAQRVLQMGAERYTGVDGSAGMLERAKARPHDARVQWLHADLSRPVPLEDGCADDVLITLVLEHVQDLRPVMQEVARLLVPGGAVRVLEIHAGLVQSGVSAHFWHEGEEYRLPSFGHPAAELLEVLGAAGLSPGAACEWFANAETIARCAKLARHQGRAVVIDVSAVKPR